MRCRLRLRRRFFAKSCLHKAWCRRTSRFSSLLRGSLRRFWPASVRSATLKRASLAPTSEFAATLRKKFKRVSPTIHIFTNYFKEIGAKMCDRALEWVVALSLVAGGVLSTVDLMPPILQFFRAMLWNISLQFDHRLGRLAGVILTVALFALGAGFACLGGTLTITRIDAGASMLAAIIVIVADQTSFGQPGRLRLRNRLFAAQNAGWEPR